MEILDGMVQTPDLFDCFPFPSFGDLCLTLPGGLKICSIPSFELPQSPCEALMALLRQINSALVPLSPLLMVIELVQAVIDAVMSIPQSIIELDPALPIKKIIILVEKFVAIMGILPIFSLFQMIKDLVGFILSLFECIISFLEAIRDQIELLTSAVAIADSGSRYDLKLVLDCNKVNIEFQFEAFADGFGNILGILSIFMKFFDMFTSAATWFMDVVGAQCSQEQQDAVTDIGAIFDTLTSTNPALDTLDTLIAAISQVVNILTIINSIFTIGDMVQAGTDALLDVVGQYEA